MKDKLACSCTTIVALVCLCLAGTAWGQACGDPAAGDCCSANGTPGCDDASCCKTVCATDAFCCDTSWDSICAGEAEELCGDLCGGGGGPCPGEGDCCSANGTPGCNDAACCETVCAADSFCCETSWDSICAGEAEEMCGDLCGGGGGACPGDGDCCAEGGNGTPGCNDAACCEAVCAVDSFCCETSWDGICAGEAADLCEICSGGGGSDCCEANGTPGCDDPECEAAVCAVDSFCCDTSWDSICAGEAEELCGDLCGGGGGPCPGDGDCCSANGTPGCNDAACCESVCAADAFCCDTSWDSLCADAAAQDPNCDCGGGGGCPGEGDCCTANGTPGCNDAACCETVCAVDSFCCETSWDSICADEAADLCEICDGGGACPGEGDCCSDNGTPGCNNAACCETVCAVDAFCCDTSWDSICADEAAKLCDICGGPDTCPWDLDDNGSIGISDLLELLAQWGGPGSADFDGSGAVGIADLLKLLGVWGECPIEDGCGSPDAGDCCAANGTPFCDDAGCCESVCAVDSFCCDTSWDSICADEAAKDPNCDCGGGAACPGEGGDCCSANGTPGCDDTACCEAICAADAFCCDVSWDSLCADAANKQCDVCNAPASDCCEANGTPGCDDPECEAAVCEVDSFCCDTEWDSICAGQAEELCGDLCSGGGGGGPCGDPAAGDCCSANGTPGCDDAACCEAICAADAFCCETSWDSLCAGAAEKSADCDCGGGGGSDCCEANGTPGCDDPECEAAVCNIDPFCCDTSWDSICAGEAADLCSICQ